MLKSKFFRFCQALLCFTLALFLTNPASAISLEQQLFFSRNGIDWYNPSAINSSCYSGDISIAGSTAMQKIWSGLNTFMTPEQAAGVMGNMNSESNFNPVRHEMSFHNTIWPNFDIVNDTSRSYGIGLIQWSFGRRTRLLQYIQSNDASLLDYFMNPDTYSKSASGGKTSGDLFLEAAGEAVFDRLIQLELQYLKDELNTYSSYKGIFDQTTVYDATKYFLERVEVPQNPQIESHMDRVETAQQIYDELNGISLSPSGSNGTNITGSNVTIIGDSITVRSSSSLSSKLSGVDINAEVGRSFSTGIEVAKSMELRNVVVFALGTNSSNVSSSQIQEVIDLVGPSRSLYFITNFGVGYDFSNNNRLFNEAANNNSNVHVIDWANSVSNNPEKYIAVNESTPVHPTSDGITLFTDLISNAVTSKNLTSDGCTVGGNFQQTILDYAWPEYHPGKFVELMPKYAEVVSRRKTEGKFVGGGAYPGVDCGGFVAIVLATAGIDSNYPGGTVNQENYVIANGWTLLNADNNTPIDTSILQPGDVAFSNYNDLGASHTFIFVGDIPGFNSKIASASYGGDNTNSTYWRSPMAGGEDLVHSDPGYNSTPVRWYRKG